MGQKFYIMTKLTVRRIPKVNTLVINQTEGQEFFVSTHNNIVISVANLAVIISFLVKNNFMSHKVLEGILEEYNSLQEELSNDYSSSER